MLRVTIDGLQEARALLEGFSERRFRAAVATALTRTGRALRDEWRTELSGKVDRPTPLTRNAPTSTLATAASLATAVELRDTVANGQPPSEYLRPLEFGGARGIKKFEQALIAQGSMPAGHYAIPTDYARRDGYGNVARGQIVQILVQLAGGSVRAGYRRVISASAQRRAQAAVRAGREYVAVLAHDGELYPGIYARVAGGGLRMVFSYERAARYRRQLTLIGRARERAQRTFAAELRTAVDQSLQRLRGRRA